MRCERPDRDRRGRIVATRHTISRDIKEAMVPAGLALAYRREGRVYLEGFKAGSSDTVHMLWRIGRRLSR